MRDLTAQCAPWDCSTDSAAPGARSASGARRHPHRLDPGPCLRRRRTSRHLSEFVTTRRGVEGFVEPRTAVSDVTLLLVAHDGEWTRRRVPSVKWAHDFANQHQVPSYDAAVVGIPQRMRDYNRRKKAEGI